MIDFDSYEIALAAYESDNHKKALAALGPGVERDFRIAEGVSNAHLSAMRLREDGAPKF